MEKTEGPRSFARFVEGVADGELHRLLSEELFKLGDQLQCDADRLNIKAKGTLTIKLNLSVDPRGVAGVEWDIDGKPPKHKHPAAQAWITPGGNFVFENPKQTKFDLREVPKRELVAHDDDYRNAASDED